MNRLVANPGWVILTVIVIWPLGLWGIAKFQGASPRRWLDSETISIIWTVILVFIFFVQCAALAYLINWVGFTPAL
ncbi:MAG: hypothetical protein V2A61_01280 [Calditrichota bacterium]